MTNETTPKMSIGEAIKTMDEIMPKLGPHDGFWPGIGEIPKSWSGTKGYVWADAFGDVKEGLRAVWDTCQERGLAVQVASPAVFDFPDDHPQAHKGLVITFPRRATLQEDIEAVIAALEAAGYQYGKGKTINGATLASGSLSTRFEHFLDMGRDVDQYEHAILYRPSVPLQKHQIEEAAKALRALHEGKL